MKSVPVTYPKQKQVDRSGKESDATTINDGPAFIQTLKPRKATYDIVGGQMFIRTYARILIRRRAS